MGIDAKLETVLYQPGIREDVRQVAPMGSLARAENVRYSPGEGIVGRPGTWAVSPNTIGSLYEILNNSQSVGVLSRVGDANMLGIDGVTWARDDASGAFNFAGVYGTVRPVGLRKGLPAGAGRDFGATRSAVAVNSAGYLMIASASGSVVYYRIEAPNGTTLFYGTDSGSKCAVVAQGTTFLLIIQQSASIIVSPHTIVNGVVTITNHAVVGSLLNPAAYWDANSYSSNLWLLTYQSGATTVVVRALANSVSQFTGTFTCTGLVPLSIWGDLPNQRVWVGLYDNLSVSGDVKWRAYDISGSTFGTLVSNGTIATAASIYGPPLFGPGDSGTGPFYVFQISNNGSAPYTRGFIGGWFNSGTLNPDSSLGTIGGWHATPVSKPDSRQRVWMVTGNESSNWRFQRPVLLRFRRKPTGTSKLNIGIIEAALDESSAPLNTTHLPSRSYDYFHQIAEGSMSHCFLLPRVLQQGPGNNELVSLDLVEYVPSEIAPHRQAHEFGAFTAVCGQPVEFFGLGAGQFYVGGGGVGEEHEAAGAFEIGFAYRPAVLTATQGAGGDLTALGVYSWVFVFEWTSPLGERVRSLPSAPYSLTLTGGNQKVTFQVTSLEWHQKTLNDGFFPPTLIAYRTIAGGTSYFRESVPSTGNAVSTIGSNGVVTYVSGNAAGDQTDAKINSDEFVYTDGGVLGNALAPTASFGCRTAERLALGGQFVSNVVTFSKIIVPGEPIQFTDSPAFDAVLPEPCTGLAYQDGIVVAFAKRAIYLISGDGPNDQGSGSFSPPSPICRDVGCIDYRSVLETAVGIFFQGERGIYLLPRGFGPPQYVGRAIQSTMRTYPYVLGCTYFESSSVRTVRYLLSSTKYLGSGGSQVVLVFDLEANGWSMDTFARGLQAIGSWSAEPSTALDAGPVLALSSLSTANICAYWEQGRLGDNRDAANGTPELFSSLVETNVLRLWGFVGWGALQSFTFLASSTSGNPVINANLYMDGVFSQTFGPWLPPSSSEETYAVNSVGTSATGDKCTGFRVRHTWQQTTSSFATATVFGFQVAALPLGERRTPQSERVA